MSLLDSNAPHVVTVYPEVEDIDSRGNPVLKPAETGVAVRCRMQAISAGRDPGSDRRIGDRTAFRFSAREAPIGRWSRVSWRGMTFTVESGPFRHDETPAVSRVTCTLLRES